MLVSIWGPLIDGQCYDCVCVCVSIRVLVRTSNDRVLLFVNCLALMTTL